MTMPNSAPQKIIKISLNKSKLLSQYLPIATRLGYSRYQKSHCYAIGNKR